MYNNALVWGASPRYGSRPAAWLLYNQTMKYIEVKKVMERVSRLFELANSAKGNGTSWTYVFPDGIETTYILNDVKAMEELEDEIFNAFIWFWNFKDYLKALLEHQGGNPNRIEKLVNDDLKLAVCADIANRLKHGSLIRSRSGKYPTLGSLGYTFPQSAMKKLTIRGSGIEIDSQNHEDIEIKLPIVDPSNAEIGQAFDFLSYAIATWEKELESIKAV